MKKILLLPDAGIDNPFQHQLIRFLELNGARTAAAPSRRFLASVTAVAKHKPDVLYYDWIQSFIVGRNFIMTFLKCLSFACEIIYLTRIRRLPILHTLHNMRTHAGLWPRTEFLIYRFFLSKCTRIRVYSHATRRKAGLYFGLDPARVHVIQDVPYHHYYHDTTNRTESRLKLQISSNAFVYLFLGMIKPYKGIEELIQDFVAMDDPEKFLLIAGKGDNPAYEARVESLAQANARIRFHNHFVPEQEVQHYMHAADVVVLPFKNIEHSGSIDLAMSFRKAVVTKKTPFTSELLAHQADLLFDSKRTSLTEALQAAKRIDAFAIGQINFQKADQGNHRELLRFFEAGT